MQGGRYEKIFEKMERNYKRYSYGYRVAVVCRIYDLRGDGKMKKIIVTYRLLKNTEALKNLGWKGVLRLGGWI